MSDLYTALRVSPRKKRLISDDEDDSVLTPKKLRTMPTTPFSTPRKPKPTPPLPESLARFQSIQNSLHLALSHALATSAVSPSENGVVPNVLNNHTLTAAAGLSRTCTLDDIKRLCWLWEWDGRTLPRAHAHADADDDDDNPFLEGSSASASAGGTALSSEPPPKQWTRGAMGLVITPTTHLSKAAGKRVPAYGIGIEVEMDIDKAMGGGMAAVARWAAGRERRMRELTRKLNRWVELHKDAANAVPPLPLADLPPLVTLAPKQSALTQRLASLSPKSPRTLSSSTPGTLQVPSSPTRSPTKPRATPGKRTIKEFAIPFPITPISLPRHKNKDSSLSSPFKAGVPQTPSTPRTHSTVTTPSTPRTSTISFPSRPSSTTPSTPRTSTTSFPSTPSSSRPSTPVHQTGADADTVPATPTTSRRAALYERIRKKSESVPATPTKAKITSAAGMSRDQLLKLGQEEIRRRCLLGRLGGVAESIWMFFATPVSSTSITATPRKRRTLPTSEVVHAIIKSSPVPISSAEAFESINLLTSLCPFFLRKIDVGGEDWLEMPASAGATQPAAPASPSRRKGGYTSDEELRATLSPRRVKKESGGLREVRERIKRELELSE